MVSYIVDEYGNETHAVVPIDEWENIQSILSPENISMGTIECTKKAMHGRAIPSVVFDINTIMNKIDTEKNINEIINIHYKYLELFDSKDIGLLYLIRTVGFNMYMLLDVPLNNNTNELLDQFYELFQIKNLHNEKLKYEEFKSLQKIFLLTATPKELVNTFKKYFQLGVSGFSKRIRKDAEIKRLFFYDFSVLYPLVFPDKITELGELKEKTEDLAEIIYSKNTKSSAIAQMYKAIRDSKERIEQEGWKIYIGI